MIGVVAFQFSFSIVLLAFMGLLNTTKTIGELVRKIFESHRQEAKSMGRPKKNTSSDPPKKLRPALTPEARENQMIALAIDLAEKKLLDGTAPSQVITHYLKLGTTQARLEKEKLERENELLRAKTKALESAERVEELYANAIKVMRIYGGYGSEDNEDSDVQ